MDGGVWGWRGESCWHRAMKCTISPRSIVLGVLKGKQGEWALLDFELRGFLKLHFAIWEMKIQKRGHTRGSPRGVAVVVVGCWW